MLRSYISLLLFLLVFCVKTIAQEPLRSPFNFPIVLSGNFGELRSTHFHSGIDFKTQGVEGKPIHAVNDGYVSRIGVSPWGYGNALYIDHPDGTTTVYAHLKSFDKKIEDYIKEQQYIQESFAVNLYPDSEQFVFKRGDIIALAGNSGSSGGPHLHFEVRDTQTEDIIDPLLFYKDRVKDTQAPQAREIIIYPFETKGIVNGSSRPQKLRVAGKHIQEKITAWGEIGLGIKAFDSMDGTSNIYGVKSISLTLDNDEIFHYDIERFAFDETRYINSFNDYDEWKNNRSKFIKCFVEPGNHLRFIRSKKYGIVTIDEERIYNFTYTLSDIFGNKTTLTVNIEGKKQDIPPVETEGSVFFNRISDNRFREKGIFLSIKKGNLYDNLNFRYSVKEDSTAIANTHILHNKSIPLHQNGQLSLRVQNDILENKKQYGIISIYKGKVSWIGGEFENGWVNADIRELGTYSVRTDTTAPKITPVNMNTWVQNRNIVFKISDNLSGIKEYRGEINGEFILFEFDGKKGLISYKFDPQRLPKGTCNLTLTATDACENKSTFTHTFTW